MKYSFILIAYNEANNILACIDSILQQDKLGNSFEIIIFDDGSTDDTSDIVSAAAETNKHIHIISDGSNHGRGFGRYTGVNDSSGQYVVMVDADIILPPNWLASVLPSLRNHDIAGGIAVPDGDVAYVFRRFNLQPKVVMGSTTITGNNGIYKRRVFQSVNFDPTLREGEDVDFNHRAKAAGITEICVPGLTVEHQEHKSYRRSLGWLYQSGIGATRQLVRFGQIRVPDLASVAIIGITIFAVAASLLAGWYWSLAVPFLAVIGVSTLHLKGKFYFSIRKLPHWLAAIATNTVPIICYTIGRLAGFVVLFNARNNAPSE